MQKDIESIIKEAREIALPIVESEGMELVDVEFKTERGLWVLRFYIDREGGVTVNDCATISEQLSVALDVKDIIPYRYNLEVSSPGLDRPLVSEKDFNRNIGRDVKIRTKEPISGRRNFKGKLIAVINGAVIIEEDGKYHQIRIDNINKARLVIEF